MNVTTIDAPFFEDLNRGQVFHAPGITILDAHALLHQALFGDRMALPLNRHLSEQVTGEKRGLVHPCVVANIAIGQSTEATQRVKANLFYSDFIHDRSIWVGDTLSTTSEVVALRRNRVKKGRRPTGLAVLKVIAVNQKNETVLEFLRCPMLPCRDDGSEKDVSDDVDAYRREPSSDDFLAVSPTAWKLGKMRDCCRGPLFDEIEVGQTFVIDARDTVTDASLLVRSTLNMAWTHLDAAASHLDSRLVYGGHTISMACAQVSRALPGIATILGWLSCDHLAPVIEGDVLQTQVTVVDKMLTSTGDGICTLHAETFADRNDGGDHATTKVLDWRFSVLMC